MSATDETKATDEKTAPVDPKDLPNPHRAYERERLEADALGEFDVKLQSCYVVQNMAGERLFFTLEKADAEQRLKEMASGSTGRGLPPHVQPDLVLVEAKTIETVGYHPDVAGEDHARGVTGGFKP